MTDLMRSLERERLQQGSVSALVQLSEVLSAARSLEDVAAHVPGLVRLAVGADFAVVGLREPDGRHLRYLRIEDLPEDLTERWLRVPLDVRSPPTDAARDGLATSFATTREAVAAYPHLTEDLVAMGYEASVNVPLSTAGTLLGVFGVAWVHERSLSSTEKEVLASLAGFTAQAVTRLHLLAERRSAAETLQRSLLTELPRLEHLELRALYAPAAREEQVGGDWYDAMVLPDGATALVVGDVSGHDMTAAAVMGQMRGLLRAYAWDRAEPPADVVRRFDEAVAGLRIGGMASVVLARIEESTGARPGEPAHQVRWSNAGHPPPVVLHPDGSVHVLESAPELVVGVDARASRSDHAHPLPPGATLLLYTDGLIERRDRDLADGLAALREALARCHCLGVEDLLDAVLAEVAGPDPQDDCALLAVRLRA